MELVADNWTLKRSCNAQKIGLKAFSYLFIMHVAASVLVTNKSKVLIFSGPSF